ncbi:two-component system, OmpR family, bacitracin resistance response regulator BceR [Pelagirhabdus alkalitolerans]|uniref:Two-component system, OmpR family, bacitracin resistance response regulator BceR n=1 Tax=Pelagirhabdus alkalitolerans TaxID=1612202 RepID=A0A1G6JY64_9BACI|nr:response regulator transcription factor [Pelagirhabdus alkalitolerans]SDC23654.1 two-component system, OmpR family, bacitracin resistance response regulator BceR [Pelagirhabdus alkalitolerans]
MSKIFIIEDDQSLFKEIKERLEEWDYSVHGVTDFANILNDFIRIEPDLVVIDITLPKYDGFYWCRRIRDISNLPIIFLSSRNHPSDMVMSMQLGSDDYVQKPFNFDVLVAKVQALLRRAYQYQNQEINVTKFRDAVIDFKKLTVVRGDQEIHMTKNESFILSVLVNEVNQAVSRETLIEKLWDDSRFINDNTLTVNVNRIRKKLDDIGLDDAIITKTGLGYMLKE